MCRLILALWKRRVGLQPWTVGTILGGADTSLTRSCKLGELRAEQEEQTSASLKRTQTSPFCWRVLYFRATHLHLVLLRKFQSRTPPAKPKTLSSESRSAHWSRCVRAFTAPDGAPVVASSGRSAPLGEFKIHTK